VEKVAATTSFDLVGARNRDAFGRSVEHSNDPSPRPPLVDLDQFDVDSFAGESAFYEDNSAVFSSGDAGAVTRRRGDMQFHLQDGIAAPQRCASRGTRWRLWSRA